MSTVAERVAMVREKCTIGATLLKASTNGVKGEVDVIANTGYLDKQGDEIKYGAWQGPIDQLAAGRRKPLIFWQHDLNQLPLGSVSRLQELHPLDNRVPTVEGQPKGRAGALIATLSFALDTSRGADAFKLMKSGHVSEVSVQFDLPDDFGYNTSKGRVIEKIGNLYEISLVVAGASYGTQPLEARSALHAVGTAWAKAYTDRFIKRYTTSTIEPMVAAFNEEKEADRLAVEAIKKNRVLSLTGDELRRLARAPWGSKGRRLFEQISALGNSGQYPAFKSLLLRSGLGPWG